MLRSHHALHITSGQALYWKENTTSLTRLTAWRQRLAGLVMVKSFASYELCMAFLVEPCVCVVPKVDKFSCADNHADFKASNINVYLIPPSLCFTARIARRIMHIKRPGHPSCMAPDGVSSIYLQNWPGDLCAEVRETRNKCWCGF